MYFQKHTPFNQSMTIDVWQYIHHSVYVKICGNLATTWLVIPPASTKLIEGYTGITLSVCPSVRLSVCPSVDRIVSALYLQQYSSDPFYICTSYQATSEGVSRVMPVSKFKHLKFWRIFKICNVDFVIFWLGIQYDSIVWVIMRRRGVSSERRRSSCSSLSWCRLTISHCYSKQINT